MNIQRIPFTEKCKATAFHITLCAAIALLSCFAAETPIPAVNAVVTLAGDLAVLTMFTLYFAMTANAFSEAYPEHRPNIFCTADCAAFVLKIVFAALCSLSGGILIHAAALAADAVVSKMYTVKLMQIHRQSADKIN